MTGANKLSGVFPRTLEGPSHNLTAEQIDNAVIVVAGHSKEVEDFKELAAILGLHEG